MNIRAVSGSLGAALIFFCMEASAYPMYSWTPAGKPGWGLVADYCTTASNWPTILAGPECNGVQKICAPTQAPGNVANCSLANTVRLYSKWLNDGNPECPQDYTWHGDPERRCFALGLFQECTASGLTPQECDTVDKPPIIADFPQDMTKGQVCKTENNIVKCFSSTSWPVNCGEINGKYNCVRSLDPGENTIMSAGNPPASVNDSNGEPLASNPVPTAANYNYVSNSYQGQYYYGGPGANTGTGNTGTGAGTGTEIDTSGLAQETTAQGVLNALDGTADTSGLDPEAQTGPLQAIFDATIDDIESYSVGQAEWIQSIFPLPETATCVPYEQTISLPYFSGNRVFDPCDVGEEFRIVLGYLFYGLTFLYLISLLMPRRES